MIAREPSAVQVERLGTLLSCGNLIELCRALNLLGEQNTKLYNRFVPAKP